MSKAAPASTASHALPRILLSTPPPDIGEATPDACGCKCDDTAMERHLFDLTPGQRAALAPRAAEVAAIARGADIERRMRLGLPVTPAPCRWWAALMGWRP